MRWPTPPDPRQIERVLIVKLSAIGDVAYALPVSAALGDAFPHWQMTWIVEERAAPLVLSNPYLHDVMVLPNDWYRRLFSWKTLAGGRDLWRDLRQRQFDLVIDLQALSRSAVVAWASGARYRFGYDWLREIAPLFLTRVPRRPQSVHVVDQLLDVARFLGAPVTDVKFPFQIAEEDDARASELLEEAGIAPAQPFIVINPTGDAALKGWGQERWVALLDELAPDLEPPAVLIGGPEDRVIGSIIEARARRRPANLIERTSLMEMVAILRRATLHLSGDTGSAHLAAVLGTRVLTIFGRNNPARVHPYGQPESALHHREQCALVCRRYHAKAPLNSNQDCLSPPPSCLAAVTVAEVAAAVRKHIRSTSVLGCAGRMASEAACLLT